MRYSVKLVGWPLDKFANPSKLGNSLPPLRQLREALVSGRCHWVKLTPSELSERVTDYQAAIDSGEIVPATRKKRKDAGQPRTKKLKTVELIESNVEGETSTSESSDSDSSSSSSSSEDEAVPAPCISTCRSARTTKAPIDHREIPQPITSTSTDPLPSVSAPVTGKRGRGKTSSMTQSTDTITKTALRRRRR
jgi:hypothetical protein